MRLFAIARREIITITRDKRSLLLIIFLPLMLLILYGYGVTFDISHVSIAFYDESRSAVSRSFIDKYANSEYFDVEYFAESPGEIDDLLINDKIILGLIIPPDFHTDIRSKNGGNIQVLVNGSDANTAGVAMGYHAAVFNEFVMENFNPPPGIQLPDVEAKLRIWYNHDLKSANFIVPGVIVIIMMLLGAILTSTAIVREKESGTIEQIMASPIRSWEYIVGKITPYIIISLFDVILVVIAAHFVFSVPIKGNLFLLGFFSVLFLANALGIGLFVSTIAENITSAQLIAIMISLLPSILLSGFIFPISSMPDVIQAITYIIPARYFMEILRGIFLKGIGFQELWIQGLFLVINASLFLGITAIRFKKRLD